MSDRSIPSRAFATYRRAWRDGMRTRTGIIWFSIGVGLIAASAMYWTILLVAAVTA